MNRRLGWNGVIKSKEPECRIYFQNYSVNILHLPTSEAKGIPQEYKVMSVPLNGALKYFKLNEWTLLLILRERLAR